MTGKDMLRDQIRDRYRTAALAVDASGCCNSTVCAPEEADRFGPELYDDTTQAELPRTRLVREPRLRQPGRGRRAATPAKSCWTSAPAAASTCCSPPAASDRPARPTAST